MNELTVIQAINKCQELKESTGKDWFFKANKGLIKLSCDYNNDY